jgi:hypothetical protein
VTNPRVSMPLEFAAIPSLDASRQQLSHRRRSGQYA